jgi:glucose-1-phosphate adenylyltransferase
MNEIIAVILGGGRGTRLFPLTQFRSKPAVPIGASYRLVDVAVSNCIHANLRRVFVVTQYRSESLNRHVATTYGFDPFSSGFVEVLAAEQTDEGGDDWFAGTADAIRKSMKHVGRENWDRIVILSGDQLYRADLCAMLERHDDTNADVTVATVPVPASQTSGFGIMKVDGSGRIVHFDEKPPPERLPGLESRLKEKREPMYLASMGIYVFNRKSLIEAIANPKFIDFGGHVIPSMLERFRVNAYLHDAFWEDVGTIRSYFDANIALTSPKPTFSFHDPVRPIYTQRRFLSPTKAHSCRLGDVLVADGCFLDHAEIDRAVIGIRSQISPGARIRNSLVLGADFYEAGPNERGAPALGIGAETVVENAIIDKNARIGRGVRIVNARGLQEHDGESFYVRDGIVIVPKGAVIADGTEI